MYVVMMGIALTRDLPHKAAFVVTAAVITLVVGIAIDRLASNEDDKHGGR